MQRWMTFLLCIACLIPITASAHSGGTDYKGGHYNRSTGEYHYHHGYSAHQHIDSNGDGILECPYETKTLLKTESKKESIKSSDTMFIIAFIEFCVIFLLVAVFIFQRYKMHKASMRHFDVVEQMENDFAKKSEQICNGLKDLSAINEKIRESQRNLDSLNRQIDFKEKEKEQLILKVERIRNAPIDVTFANDGYPIWWDISNKKPYGDFTVYYNHKAQVFHTDFACAPYFAHETHLFKALAEGRPCKKCAKKFDGYTIPNWFITKTK